MSEGNVIFLFEGKPVNELGFWDNLRYQAALSRSYRGLSGNLDGTKLTANGITVEFVNQQNQGGQSNEKR